MFRSTILGTAAALLLLGAGTVGECRAHGYSYGYGYGYAPVYRYGGYSYGPTVVYPAPVYVQPSYYGTRYYGTPYTVRYRPREVKTKYYTPWGTHEYEVKYDRWGNVRDVDYDFDD